METAEICILGTALAISYAMLGIGIFCIWRKSLWEPEVKNRKPVDELDAETLEKIAAHRIKATIAILILSTILGVASLFALVPGR